MFVVLRCCEMDVGGVKMLVPLRCCEMDVSGAKMLGDGCSWC